MSDLRRAKLLRASSCASAGSAACNPQNRGDAKCFKAPALCPGPKKSLTCPLEALVSLAARQVAMLVGGLAVGLSANDRRFVLSHNLAVTCDCDPNNTLTADLEDVYGNLRDSTFSSVLVCVLK